MNRFSSFLFVAVVCTVVSQFPADAVGQSKRLPVSTSVKVVGLPTPPADDAEMMAPMTRQTAVTLPGQKLPQYQTDYDQTQRTADLANGEVLFLLSPRSVMNELGRPLLVRIVATIDGEPFMERRQRRVVAVAAGEPDTAAGLVRNALSDLVDQIALDADDSDTESEKVESSNDTDNQTQSAYTLAVGSSELAERYAAATGEAVTEPEAGWLVGHWTEGPPLLLLNSYFQTFRAGQRPAFIVLDRDEDGVLSTTEIENSVESLERCDANGDDIVDVLEVSRRAMALSDFRDTPPVPEPLLSMPSDLVGLSRENPVLYEPFQGFDTNEDGVIDADEVASIRVRDADLVISVQFSTKDAATSKLVLNNLTTSSGSISVDKSVQGISFRIAETPISLTAVQMRNAEQVSLGAVIDGYPLLPQLDPNDDGRLTIRERRELVERIREFDSNGDGMITTSEAQSPLRICIGLGATVHRELAELRSLALPATKTTKPGPDWFVRMDRNADNDLSRREFPGTDEQFQSLDRDDDDLVSATEAQATELE